MALSLVRMTQAGGGNPPPAITLGVSANAGDIIVADCVTNSGDPVSFTFTDNVNAGNYTSIGLSRLIGGTPFSIGSAWIKMQTAGNPTVSVTLGSSKFGTLRIVQITGFVNVPTIDIPLTAFASDNSGTSTAAAISCNNNFFPEVCMVWMHNPGGSGQASSTVTGWTRMTGTGNDNWGWYQIPSFQGSPNNFSNTLSVGQTWALMLTGIADVPASIPLMGQNIY